MPNSTGHPTRQEMERKRLDEAASHKHYEYLMWQDAAKVQADFAKLGAKECMILCFYHNIALDEREIVTKAKYACERAKNETKAIRFTNYYDQFEELATQAYKEGYSKSQEIFSLKLHLLKSMQADFERDGDFDGAYRRLVSDSCWR